MNQLSASASIVLSYARERAVDGIAEIDDEIQLPEHIVVSACAELKSAGKISDFKSSDDSVELIIF